MCNTFVWICMPCDCLRRKMKTNTMRTSISRGQRLHNAAVPFLASMSEKYTYPSSETKALFQTGIKKTEASIDTSKGQRGHPINILCCNKNTQNP